MEYFCLLLVCCECVVVVCEDGLVFGVDLKYFLLRPRLTLKNFEGLVLKEIVCCGCFYLLSGPFLIYSSIYLFSVCF